MSHSSTKLTPIGISYVVVLGFVLGGAIIRDINLMLIVAGVMIGPLALSWRISVRMLRKVILTREFPDGMTAGENVGVQLSVQNLHRRQGLWGIVVVDQVRRLQGGEVDDAVVVEIPFPHVPRGGTRKETYEGRIPCRGIYAVGPAMMRTSFPMGLITHAVHFENASTLVVHPRLGTLTSNWTHATAPIPSGVGSFHRRHSQSEGEYHSLRDYRPGDSRRWIHWRTSTKRRKLTVRQFERRHNHDLMIVLELPLEDEGLERAIRFVATVAYSQCRQANSRLTVVIAGEEMTTVSGMASSGLFQELSHHLAAANGATGDRMPRALELARGQLRGETRLMFVSPRPLDPHDTDRFAEAWDQIRFRTYLSRATTVCVSSPEFAELYHEDVP